MGAFTQVAAATGRRSTRTAIASIAIIGATALVLSGCAPAGEEGEDGPADFFVGTILPQSGNLSALGPPEIAGVDLAVQDIEAADVDFTVDVLHTDSGDNTNVAWQTSVPELVAADVDIAVGAASSGVSLNFINDMIENEIVQISPANTAADFSTYDDDGYYWRTAPSDVLQGRVLANKLEADGKTNVAFIYQNDAYGVGLYELTAGPLGDAGIDVAAAEIFEPNNQDFQSIVTNVLATSPDALVAITFAEIHALLPALETAGFDFANLYLVDGNVTEVYGNPDAPDSVDIAGAQGTNPGVQATEDFQARLAELDSGLTTYAYAAEAYDAVIMAALAGLQGGDFDGPTIRDNLQSVSEGGEKCETFADCAALIADGEDIDYDGISGPIEFDDAGDLTAAYISIYQFPGGLAPGEWVEQVFGEL